MSQIFDRFSRIVRSVMNDPLKSSSRDHHEYEDSDMRDAWEELNSFLDGEAVPDAADPGRNIPEAVRKAYIRLGLKAGAPLSDAQKAYRELLYTYHPDRNSSPEAGRNTREILEAFRSIKAWQAGR